MVEWSIKHFSELNLEELYASLQLRELVFTLEQHCSDQDLDGLDQQSIHLMGWENHGLVAYARILPLGVYDKEAVSFGRLAVSKNKRGQGFGRELMQQIQNYIRAHYRECPVKFSAQFYLKSFYQSVGYKVDGEVYDEGGIPHIAMKGSKSG